MTEQGTDTLKNSQDNNNAQLKMIIFTSGDIQLLIEQRYIIGIESIHTKHNKQIIIKPIEKLLGLNLHNHSIQRIKRLLILNTDNSRFALKVDEPIELKNLASDAIRPLPALITARN